tara:strand:+ start:324 stop:491 length:168 start_codon:yes stop_codon:yes gene_type:complete
MYKTQGKDWINYCKALNVSPYDPNVKKSDYYQRGFTEWKRLKREFTYFEYMANNV